MAFFQLLSVIVGFFRWGKNHGKAQDLIKGRIQKRLVYFNTFAVWSVHEGRRAADMFWGKWWKKRDTMWRFLN